MKFCHLKFDAKYCFWKQDQSKPIQDQIKFCRDMNCKHGSITEKTLNNEERVAFITCDYSWNPFDWKPTTEEQREEIFG